MTSFMGCLLSCGHKELRGVITGLPRKERIQLFIAAAHRTNCIANWLVPRRNVTFFPGKGLRAVEGFIKSVSSNMWLGSELAGLTFPFQFSVCVIGVGTAGRPGLELLT